MKPYQFKQAIVLTILCLLPLALMALRLPHTSVAANSGGDPFALTQGQTPALRTADQAHKNIQVFKGMPTQQFYAAMNFMSAALGVSCGHCHVEAPGAGLSLYDKDDKETKRMARKMIAMVQRVNAENFGGQNVITCATCHQGHPKPSHLPPPGQDVLRMVNGEAARWKASEHPSVEQIIDKYVQAVGGKTAFEALRSRLIKMSVAHSNGTTQTQELLMAAPNRLLMTTTSANGVSSYKGYDGTKGWAKDGENVREMSGRDLDIFLSEVNFNREIRLKELYPKLTLVGQERLGRREAFVVDAIPATRGAERWWFDIESGLLLRRRVEIKTALGSIPEQTDFDDYREVDGIKLPFTIRRASQWVNSTNQITEIKHNVSASDAQFNPPPNKQ